MMNIRIGLFTCGIVLSMITAFTFARPRPPETHMAVVVPTEFPVGKVPLKLVFHFSTAADRKIAGGDIEYALLAEDGSQAAIDPFISDDSNTETIMKGTDPTYEPQISFDPYLVNLAGKKYQLVCTWHSEFGLLAGSARFTLTK
jgi:hypothetical protein